MISLEYKGVSCSPYVPRLNCLHNESLQLDLLLGRWTVVWIVELFDLGVMWLRGLSRELSST